MKFDDLQSKISALLTEYNEGLDELSDQRVTMADLYLAKSEAFCTPQDPGVVNVVPPEFLQGVPENQPAPQSLSAAAAGAGASIQCCRPGFKGVFRNGVFINCFPAPGGECDNYQGPIRCNP